MLELKVCVSHSRKLSSSAHYPDSGWTCSKVRAVRQWPRFSFARAPPFSYPLSALSQVHPAGSSYEIKRK